MANLENIAMWVEALESGDFNQVHGALQRYDHNAEPGFCCLGVAAVISNNGNRDAWAPDKSGVGGYRRAETFLGLTVDETKEFITMNDDLGLTFKEIAEKAREKFLKEPSQP